VEPPRTESCRSSPAPAGARPRLFLVISGLPASGKTTLGLRMAKALDLPLLDKDEILEAMFDGLGVGDAAWRHRLSRAADVVLQRLAERSAGAVLASHWRHPQAGGASGTPTGWLPSLSASLVEIYCACPPAVAAERFLARRRHAGHLDRDKHRDEVLASFIELSALGPLAVASVVRVDSENEPEVEAIVDQVRSAWNQP
jgi:AAA domain-containing protein